VQYLRSLIVCLPSLLLTACGGGAPRDPGASAPPADPARTVSGTVLDAAGAPLGGQAIQVGGVVTTTDGAGRFAVEDVADEYDVTVVRSLEGTVFAFQGLRRRDPTLWLFESAPAPRLPLAATVHVRATLGAGEKLLVFADGASDAPTVRNADAVGGVDVAVAWDGQTGRDVALRALRYSVTAGSTFADAYSGVAAATVHVEDYGEATWDVAGFDSIGSKTVTTQVGTSGGLTVEDSLLAMELVPDGPLVPLPAPPPSASETAEVVPDLAGASFVLAAFGVPTGAPPADSAYATSRVSLAPTAQGRMTVRLPEPVALSSPAANAADVSTATTFTWGELQDGVHPVVRFEGDLLTPVVAPTVYIQSTRANVRFPDATALGLTYPAGAKYNWEVLAASWMPEPGGGGMSVAGEAEQRLSVSEKRTFDLARPAR
jgi:hypothetical protein